MTSGSAATASVEAGSAAAASGRRSAGAGGGERDLAGEYGDGVGDGVEAGRAERLERGRVGAGPGEGQLALQQGAGLGRAARSGSREAAVCGARRLGRATGAGVRRRGPPGPGSAVRARQPVQRVQQPLQAGRVGVLRARVPDSQASSGRSCVGPVGVEQRAGRCAGCR